MEKIAVFISYSHQDKKMYNVEKLYNDLKRNGSEFDIWVDFVELETSSNWVEEIENELSNLIIKKPNSRFVFFITPRSGDIKHENFCTKEIVKAIDGRVKIVPIKLSEVPVPFLLCDIQWFDFTNCAENDEKYASKFKELIEILKDPEKHPHDGFQFKLKDVFNPLNFKLDVEKYVNDNYQEREWLIKKVNYWLDNSESKEPILLLAGGPGTGKTAFAINVACKGNLESYFVAYHLCVYNQGPTKDPCRIVTSLAYYLISRIPEMKGLGDYMLRTYQNYQNDAKELFKELILNPLQEIRTEEKKIILIDALEEANNDDKNDLAEMLSHFSEAIKERIPWLKFLITTRNDAVVKRYLEHCSETIDLDKDSTEDIRTYLKANVDDKSKIDQLLDRCGNSFIYAKLACRDLKNPEYDLTNLPKGLNAYYHNLISAYLGEEFDRAVPLLNILLTTQESIKKDQVFKRLRTKYSDLFPNSRSIISLVNNFGPLLVESDGCLKPFHKSFSDWLLDEEENVSYLISRVDGLDELIDWGLEIVRLDKPMINKELKRHFYLYLPVYMIENEYDDFTGFYTDFDFWEQRVGALGTDLALSRMMVELKTLGEKRNDVKDYLFEDKDFLKVLYHFTTDLSNSMQNKKLKELGFSINLESGANDEQRHFAINYFYTNGMYDEIFNKLDIFKEEFKDKDRASKVSNALGLTYKKTGKFEEAIASLSAAANSRKPLETVIYAKVNLARILVTFCKYDVAKKTLDEAVELLNKEQWKKEFSKNEYDFKARQLEYAVHYTLLEYQLLSVEFDDKECKIQIDWIDQNIYNGVKEYSYKVDRFYPRHLQSKALYSLRKGDVEDAETILKNCEKFADDEYSKIKQSFYESLCLLCSKNEKDAISSANAQFEALTKKDAYFIEHAEFAALLSFMTGDDMTSLIDERLVPWYEQMKTLIKSMEDAGNKGDIK